MQRFLITGGGGFLGAWIARRLLERGHVVRVFDVRTDRTAFDRIVGTAAVDVEWCRGDITSAQQVRDAAADSQGIAHLAAILTPACRSDPVLGAQINVIGTINVFEAAKAHGMAKVVYASSAGVFGAVDGVVPRPATLYGAFKLACEGIALAYALDHRIGSIGFRPLIVYGPGREVGGSADVTIACREAAAGRPYVIPFVGDADAIFVDDVAAAFEAALLRETAGVHVFNLLGESTTVDGIVNEIRRNVPAADIAARGRMLSITPKMEPHDVQGVLGPLPRTSLADGVRRTIETYRGWGQ